MANMNTSIYMTVVYNYGLIFRLGSLWVGGHWSDENQRLCLNILPCLTFWVTVPGGQVPYQGHDIFRARIHLRSYIR